MTGAEPYSSLPPDAYNVEVLHDANKNAYFRYRAPFDINILIDPVLWPRTFTSGRSAYVCGAVVIAPNGAKELVWADEMSRRQLLTPAEFNNATVFLFSSMVPVLEPNGTAKVAQRVINIYSNGAIPEAAADARELVDMLILSDVDAGIPVTAVAVHEDNPVSPFQVLFDEEL